MADELKFGYAKGRVLKGNVYEADGTIRALNLTMTEVNAPSGLYLGNAIPIITGDQIIITEAGIVVGYGIYDTLVGTAESNIRGADADTLKTLSDQVDTLLDAGSGAIVVNHNWGGADALAYKTIGGVGIDNATIYVYLDSDYILENFDIGTYVKAAAITDVNGQWVKPMNLDAETYRFYYFRMPDYGPDWSAAIIVV